MEKKKFIKGALLLTLSGMICKVLGAVYRIPLGNTVGAEGMGYYQLAYPVYSVMIMLSSAGIPVALSRMVSRACAEGDLRGANEIFHVSRRMLGIIGGATGAVMFLGSGVIAAAMGMKETAFSLRMLAPSLVFVSLTASYRGVLQGRQLMGATAASQVCEQLIRLTVGLMLAAAWMPRGAEFGAGGALLGVTLSETAGLAVVMGYYAARRREFGDIGVRVEPARRRKILWEIFRIALPITVGACTMSVVGAIDSAVVMRVLTGNGSSAAEATGLFGLLTGFVQPIVNMPAVLSGAVAMSIVPALSFVMNDRGKIRRQAGFAYKLGVIIGMPCAVGVYLLAEDLLAGIYPSLNTAELAAAGRMMRIMAPGILMMAVSQVTAGVLQGIGKTTYPVLSMLLGGMLKLFLGIWLIRIPSVNIYGAAWGTLLYYAVTAAVDLIFAVRYAGLRIGGSGELRIAGCSAGMGAVVLVMRNFPGIWTAVLAGIVSYAILLIATGALETDELMSLPGCARLIKYPKRLRRKI